AAEDADVESAQPESADAAESDAEGESATADDEDAGDAGDDDESAVEEDPAEEFKAELRMQEGDWYVIHSYAGYENRVKQNLENRTISLNLEEYIFESQVPMEDVVEIKNGQRKQVRRVRMPGYVLVRMELTDES